jgi:protein SCO1/2
MKQIRIVAWVAVALMLLAVGLLHFLRPDVANLAASLPLSTKVGGPFELTTHEGKRLSSAELKGTPYAVFFGFTYCPDVCPTTLQKLSSLIERLGPDADRMRYLFISVDTERDKPEHLKVYMSNFDPRIVGLTGTPEEIASVARAYHAYYSKVPTKSGFTYNHTAEVYLMDRDGRRVATLSEKEPEEVQLKKLRRLIGPS